MIYYSQIEDKDADHPLVIAFEEQCRQEEAMYEALGPMSGPGEDEESLDYFNRYIAGDR